MKVYPNPIHKLHFFFSFRVFPPISIRKSTIPTLFCCSLPSQKKIVLYNYSLSPLKKKGLSLLLFYFATRIAEQLEKTILTT